MTTIELKSLLDSSANALDSLVVLLPPQVDDQITQFLTALQPHVDFLLPLVQSVNPDLTRDQLVQAMANGIQVAGTIKQVVGDGTAAKLASACRKLENRKILLDLIAPLL